MADEEFELRNVAWRQAFPFVRLFRTFKLAIHASRLLLALACVLCCYVGGRVLDVIWTGADEGVLVGEGGQQTEIEAYGGFSSDEFGDWLGQARKWRQEVTARAVVSLGKAEEIEDAKVKLATRPAGELLRSETHEENVERAFKIIARRVEAGLEGLKDREDRDELSGEEREELERVLLRSADYLRLVLNGNEVEDFGLRGGVRVAIDGLRRASAGWDQEECDLVAEAAGAQSVLNNVRRSEPRGPFIELLKYEERCFAGAIRGACTFRWGLAGSALERQPSLLGSIASAGNGIIWFVTQHPWYALVYAIWHFVIFAFFGGAICRHAAVQSARDETISLGQTLRFAWEKYTGLLLAPVVPAAIFLLGAIAMFIGGLITAIPFIGELLAGVFWGLALLGGFALAMILIATVLGLHLMWPTIAVEGSDAFDAVTHAVGYVGQRAWNTGFYTLVLLVYGAVSFVMVRVIGLVMLKLTHVLSNAGMSFFGTISSAETSTFSKLDAMWHMPAWSELPLLPATDGAPFWGSVFNAPLSGLEGVGAFLIACWVFLVVGLVGAFVVSFFFCGSTQMYFLLRRDVDAVDYEEILYEEPEEELPPVEPQPEPAGEAKEVEAPQPPADAPPDEGSGES